MSTDYNLWRMWWFAALYSAGPMKRMEILDKARNNSAVHSR